MLAAINPSSFLGARQYPIVVLLLDTSIRANELCALTIANTHLEDGVIRLERRSACQRQKPAQEGHLRCVGWPSGRHRP